MCELIDFKELCASCCFLTTSTTVYPIVTHTSIRTIAKHWIGTGCRTSFHVVSIRSLGHQFNIRAWIIIGVLFSHVHQHLQYTSIRIRSISYHTRSLREVQTVVIDGAWRRSCVGKQIVSDISKFSLYGIITRCQANVVITRMIDCLVPRNVNGRSYLEYAPEILQSDSSARLRLFKAAQETTGLSLNARFQEHIRSRLNCRYFLESNNLSSWLLQR